MLTIRRLPQKKYIAFSPCIERGAYMTPFRHGLQAMTSYGDAVAALNLHGKHRNDVNLHANYNQEYTQKRDEAKNVNHVSILDTYGGDEYLKKSRSYVEYPRTG